MPKMRKLILITAFFPPYLNVATSRIIKFLKYLPSCGWEVVVVCPSSNTKHTIASRNSLKQLGDSIKVLPAGRNLFLDLAEQRDSGKLALVLGQMMNNLIPPDGHLYWALGSFSYISRVVEIEKPDLVMTTCNPYSLNLVGAWLKMKFDIPWVTDFRDLWTLNQQPKRYLNFHHQGVSCFLEKYFLSRCDELIVTTENSKNRMIDKYPHLEGRITNIPNGFDLDDVQDQQFPESSIQPPQEAIF